MQARDLPRILSTNSTRQQHRLQLQRHQLQPQRRRRLQRRHQQHQFQEINHLNQQDVSLLVVDKPDSAWIQGNTGARFFNAASGGASSQDTALLTSGSFLMMSSSGL